jgi:hypothetical protein
MISPSFGRMARSSAAICRSARRSSPVLRRRGLREPVGRRILFKLSVRLQGGPNRAAHAAAWARTRAAAVAWPGHAGSPSAGVQERSRAAATTEKAVLWGGTDLAGSRPARPGRRGRAAAPGRSARCGRRLRGRRAVCPGRPSEVKGASRRKRRPQAAALEPRGLCGPSGQGSRGRPDGLPA